MRPARAKVFTLLPLLLLPRLALAGHTTPDRPPAPTPGPPGVTRKKQGSTEIIEVRGIHRKQIKLARGSWPVIVRGIGGASVDLGSDTRTDVLHLNGHANVTIENLVLRGGLRGVQPDYCRNLTLRNVICERNGKPSNKILSKGGFVGGAIHGLTLERCQFRESRGEHAFYLSGTCSKVRATDCVFQNSSRQVFQLNSAGGSGLTDMEFRRCRFVDDRRTGALNLLGAGRGNQPIVFADCEIRSSVRAVIASNYDAGRPSYIRFERCRVTGNPAVVADGRSTVWVSGGVISGPIKVSRGGKVVR